jgi:zinc transport system ATP-binding protein
VTDLSVRLGDQLVLDNVTFQVEKGTTLAILGPNGAGKTTLFRALLNVTPYTGKIDWSETVKIGYVPQRMTVTDVPISVNEFLSLKQKTGSEESILSVGLDRDVLRRRLSVLSGGEMQRVLISWAILDRPNVLLFDEPTSSVDIGSEELVYEILNKLERELGMTVLLISHDIHVVMHYSDETLALNKSVTYFGESKNLSDPGLLEKIYGSTTILDRHIH